MSLLNCALFTVAIIIAIDKVAGQTKWVKGKDTTKFYLHDSTYRSFEATKQFCQGLKAETQSTMAQIKNKEEQLAISGVRREVGGDAWLGATHPADSDPRKGKMLLWLDGTEVNPLPFAKWGRAPDYRYGTMLMSSSGYWYIDNFSGSSGRAICERSIKKPIQIQLDEQEMTGRMHQLSYLMNTIKGAIKKQGILLKDKLVVQSKNSERALDPIFAEFEKEKQLNDDKMREWNAKLDIIFKELNL